MAGWADGERANFSAYQPRGRLSRFGTEKSDSAVSGPIPFTWGNANLAGTQAKMFFPLNPAKMVDAAANSLTINSGGSQ
jgi:hypothetical protein